MPISILLPALSPSMERGNIVRWLKKEGDDVKVGDIIAEIETDKATMEIEAFDAGMLARIVQPDGSQDVAVNDVIGVLATGPEDIQIKPDMSRPAGSPVAAGQSAVRDRTDVRPSPGYSRVLASPLARRLAKARGIDLSGLTGSGPHGRVVRRDVETREPAEGSPVTAFMVERVGEPVQASRSYAAFDPGSYEEIETSGMRRTIAARLVESKQTVPHFYLTIDCEADNLVRLRAELNAMPAGEVAAGLRLTVNDFIVKALALAFQSVPEANTVWAEDRLLRFRHSDLAVAVAVEGGVFAPVIRNAEVKSLSSISAEVKQLAGRARAGKLSPQDCRGGVAAISNLGMYGVSSFQPIINPPQSFMLGVGAVEERLVSRNGQATSIRAFTVTLSCDHRAVDGALAARLLAEFKAIVEEPMRILV